MYRESGRHIYRFDGFQVDKLNRELLRDGQPLPLPKKAFDLLLVLLENNGRALTKNELLDKVWPDQFVEEVNLTVQIATLRKALREQKDRANYITTIPKHGYRFVADFQAEDDAELVIEHHTATRVVVKKDSIDKTPTESGVRSGSVRQVSHPALDDSSIPSFTEVQGEPLRSARAWWPYRRALLIGGALLVVLFGLGIGAWRYSEGRTSITPIPFQQGSTELLTSNGKANLAALSPDGNLFVYVSLHRGLETLMLGHVAGGEPVELRPAADVSYRTVKFSPDGIHIYYVVTGGEYPNGALQRIPILGGVPEKLREDISARVAFSRDMKQIAFARDDPDKRTSSLIVASVDGTTEKVLISRPIELPFRSFSPSWSPDGKTIAAGAVANSESGTYEVYVVSAADGKMDPLTRKGWNEVLATAWLPDGSGLMAVAREKDRWNNSQLFHITYPEGIANNIFSDLDAYNAATISLSSDGQLLLAIQSPRIGDVWIGPADGLSHAKQITSSSVGRCAGCLGLDWAPDGNLLHIARVKDSMSVWTMDADGTNLKQLTSEGYLDYNVKATADSRYIVFQSNRSGNEQIWRADTDGSNLKQLTTVEQNEEPAITPDGKWVVYTSGPNGHESLWRVSIDGGEPVPLSDHPLSSPSISPDGRWIACRLESDGKVRLAILPIEGGPPVKVFELTRLPNSALWLRWTPDGKAVTYRDQVNGIWRQPVDGRAPKRIEGLPEEKIGTYTWSPDGKQFAFLRGADIRDVVLIRNGSR